MAHFLDEHPADAQVNLGSLLRRNEGIRRLLNTIVKEFVGARKPENESGVHGLPHRRMDVPLTSSIYHRERRHFRVVAKASQLLKHFLGRKRQASQLVNHKFHHVVSETASVNLGQIPLPFHFAAVEFYQVFFGEGGEELDRKERIARSFLVHKPRELFGPF